MFRCLHSHQKSFGFDKKAMAGIGLGLKEVPARSPSMSDPQSTEQLCHFLGLEQLGE